MANQVNSSNASPFHSGMLAIVARTNPAVARNHVKTPPSGDPGLPRMQVYSPKDKIDTSQFQDLGAPGGLGGEVLEGNPAISARFDAMNGPMAAGLFMATTGRIRILFPFTEHATVLEGEVTLTDEAGQTHTFKPGDSYFIRQGQVILWEVKGKRVIKSFFNVVES